MTIAEFTFYNETDSMPQMWIGQGYGYKEMGKAWDDLDDDEIIYIPEFGYNKNHTVPRENAYTKSDFIRLTKENVSDGDIEQLAEELFGMVDWQYPESLIDEGFFGETEGIVE